MKHAAPFVGIVLFVVLSCIPKSARNASGAEITSPTIAGWTKTAGPNETVLLTGALLDQGGVRVSDGEQTLAARVLRRDRQKLLTVIPAHIGSGTLWLWLEDGANTVTINAPEPWWIQPNKLDVGNSTRIFGRNLDGTSPTATIVLKSKATGASYTYRGTVTEPNVISFEVDPRDASGTPVPYGDYFWSVVEPKDSGKSYTAPPGQGSDVLTIAQAFRRPSMTVDLVKDYGGIPNDGKLDSDAVNNALEALRTNGGGTLTIPPGVFEIDQKHVDTGGDFVRISKGIHVAGGGPGRTFLCFRPTASVTVNQNAIEVQSNARLTSVTVQILGNHWAPNTQRAVFLSGEGSRLENVIIDCDGTSQSTVGSIGQSMDPMDVSGRRLLVRNVEIYSPEAVYLAGTQIHIDNLRHYGAKAISEYHPSADDWGFAGAAFSSIGRTKQLILENSHVESRWSIGGHIKRFMSVGISLGGHQEMYFAHNSGKDIMATPFANAGECVLFEATQGAEQDKYKGKITVDGANRTLVHLDPPGVANPAAVGWSGQTPISLIVMNGRGLGQVREGRLLDSLTVEISEPWTVEPDEESICVLQFVYKRHILYGNELHSGSPYADASYGIVYTSKTHDNIVSNNTLVNFQVGLSDTVLTRGGDTTQFQYWNEYTGNRIIGCLVGISTTLEGSPHPDIQVIGSLFRHNVVKDLNTAIPYWNKIRHQAIRIGDSPMTEARPPDPCILAPIYEGNTIDGAKQGFYIGPWSRWVVRRNNKTMNVTHRAVEVDPSVQIIEEQNEDNTLPRIRISDITEIPYKMETRYNIGSVAMDKDYYAWGGQAASIVLELADIDGDVARFTGASGAHLSGNRLSWTGKKDGLHELMVWASDGKGTATQKIYLFVGDMEDFEDVRQVSKTPAGYTIVTRSGVYTTSRTAVFYGSNHYHEVDTTRGYLELNPVNEEVSLRGLSDDSWSSRAILSLNRGVHSGQKKYVKLRLLESEDSYYEFYDFLGGDVVFTLRPRIRKLTKVIDGKPVHEVTMVASHRCGSNLILEQDATSIRAIGWGEILKMNDPNPLRTRTWEIRVANTPKDDEWEILYGRDIINNLFFVKDVPRVSLTTDVSPPGTGSVSPPGTTHYRPGTNVSVAATPAPGWSFDHWSGGVSGTEIPATVFMDVGKEVTAHFTRIPGPDLGGSVDTLLPHPAIIGNDAWLIGEIWNDGTAPSGSFWVEFLAVNESSKYPFRDSILIWGLSPGETFSLADLQPQACPLTIPPGYYRIEMKIDPINEVTESDETDNIVLSNRVRLDFNLPDLVVEGFDFEPQDLSEHGGTEMHFSGRIVNQGVSVVDRPFGVWFALSDDPYFRSSDDLFGAGPIPVFDTIQPSGSIDLGPLGLTWVTKEIQPGVYYVGVIVDSTNMIAEQREDNNRAWLTHKKVYVGPRPASSKKWSAYR